MTLAVVLALGSLSANAAAAPPQQSEVCAAGTILGLVESLHGTWIDKSHPRAGSGFLVTMNLVCSDSQLMRTGPGSPTDSIQIRLSDGHEELFSCATPTLCAEALPLPGLPKASSGFLQAVFNLLVREDPPPASYLSRGTALTDAVVELRGDQLNLSPALRYVDQDRYIVQLCRFDLKDVSSCTNKQPDQTVDIDGSATKPLTAASVKAGLYQVELLDAKTQHPVSSDGWVLVCDAKDFASTNSKYQDAMQSASGWSDSAPEFPQLTRAYLLTLARGT